MSAESVQAKKGFTAALLAFVVWGAFPVYFHSLHLVPALQIIAHRIVWSLVFVLVWMYFRGELGLLRAALFNRGVVLRLATSAALISLNWLSFVYGVMHGRVVETSLGYFIGPLVNVLLGVVVLSERLTPVQWTSVGIATLGVAYLTYITGGLPWIALTIAVSFSCYGLVRKVVKIDALPGLAMETLILTPLAAGYLIWSEAKGVGAFGHMNSLTNSLLIFSGPLTAFTLYLFSYAARRLSYSTLGVLQYTAPSLQFASGLLILHEPFDHARAMGFVVIWTALILYAGEGVRISDSRGTGRAEPGFFSAGKKRGFCRLR
jgi:chloramphenicol-sensitive protein RarD